MLRDYANHAANERTFLAWVRTGIAVTALGFVIERFDLFLLTAAKALSGGEITGLRIERLSTPIGRSGGLVLIFGGLALVVIATLRFLQRERLLSMAEVRPIHAGRAEIAVLLVLMLFVAGFSLYLAV